MEDLQLPPTNSESLMSDINISLIKNDTQFSVPDALRQEQTEQQCNKPSLKINLGKTEKLIPEEANVSNDLPHRPATENLKDPSESQRHAKDELATLNKIVDEVSTKAILVHTNVTMQNENPLGENLSKDGLLNEQNLERKRLSVGQIGTRALIETEIKPTAEENNKARLIVNNDAREKNINATVEEDNIALIEAEKKSTGKENHKAVIEAELKPEVVEYNKATVVKDTKAVIEIPIEEENKSEEKRRLLVETSPLIDAVLEMGTCPQLLQHNNGKTAVIAKDATPIESLWTLDNLSTLNKVVYDTEDVTLFPLKRESQILQREFPDDNFEGYISPGYNTPTKTNPAPKMDREIVLEENTGPVPSKYCYCC